MTPLVAFVTGLTTGGLTCLAVQGGLLLGLLAKREDSDSQISRWKLLLLPVAAFLVAKIVIHTLLGFGLGWLGSSISLSTTVRLWLQVIAGLFMIAAGIRLFAPRFMPWLQLTPPAGLRRFIRQRAKSEALIAPAILGLLTIFIPCGTTQAMELAAVASGNPWSAAAIMLAFTLGTVPLFSIVGILAKGTTFQRSFSAVTAVVVIALGVYSLNSVLVAIDSPYNAHNIVRSVNIALVGRNDAQAGQVSTTQTINVLATGYSPEEITVPAGQPVNIQLKTKGRLGCTSIFRIPKLDIERDLTEQSETTIATTFPQPGRYTFTCGMGMFYGTINAV